MSTDFFDFLNLSQQQSMNELHNYDLNLVFAEDQILLQALE